MKRNKILHFLITTKAQRRKDYSRNLRESWCLSVFVAKVKLAVLLFSCNLVSCNYFVKSDYKKPIDLPFIINPTSNVVAASDSMRFQSSSNAMLINQTEQNLIDMGLIDIKSIDSSIVVDLKYSTKDNFLGINVYGDFKKCYLQPDVAEKLKRSQAFLKSEFPYYSLIVFDAVRPRSIQYQMWDTLKMPIVERSKYLSNPKNGSLHNFGAAVDIGIVDENGYLLDMGTKFDYFGELAYPKAEVRLLKEGILTHNQILNRTILKKVMERGGFFGIATEWWHFNSCTRMEAFAKYKIVE